MPERRAMIDKDELRELLKEIVEESISNASHCQFNEAERTAMHTLSKVDPNVLKKIAEMYDNATNNLWRGFLALVGLGALVLAGFGAYFKIRGG